MLALTPHEYKGPVAGPVIRSLPIDSQRASLNPAPSRVWLPPVLIWPC